MQEWTTKTYKKEDKIFQEIPKEVDKYIEYSICNIEESKIGTKAEFFNKFENHKNIIKQILGKKYGQN